LAEGARGVSVIGDGGNVRPIGRIGLRRGIYREHRREQKSNRESAEQVKTLSLNICGQNEEPRGMFQWTVDSGHR
jgi:hypothetical protein